MWTVVLKLDVLKVFFSWLLGQDGKRDFFRVSCLFTGLKEVDLGACVCLSHIQPL